MIALVGNVHITADATHLCLDQRITVAWLDAAGRLRGRLVPPGPKTATLRLAQYAAMQREDTRLVLAQRFVCGKIRNAARVLHQAFEHYPQQNPLPDALVRLNALADQAIGADDRPTLLGFEGTAARLYFQALAGTFRGDLPFAGRCSYPPTDAANALLSFGYVLLGNRLAGLLEARGLDPAAGLLHEVRPGRDSLALDLLEEFRHPVVDRFVLRIGNLRILRPEHFQPDAERPGGILLRREAQRLFFSEWEKFLARPLRAADAHLPVLQLLQRQVERLVEHLRGGTAYQPLLYGDAPCLPRNSIT